MERIIMLLMLTWSCNSRALIASNLVADWRGGVGLSAVGGRVSQWNDQHQLLNNDGLGPHQLTQTNATFRPYDVTDAHSFRGVMFPWGTGTDVPHPKTYLNIPASLGGFSTTNLTVYIVATGPSAQDFDATMIWFSGLPTGWIKFSLTGVYPLTYPESMFVGGRQSTIYPPLNRAVFVGGGDDSKTTIRWNNLTQTNAPVPAVTSGTGGMISSYSGTEYFSGIIYRILVYKAAHTADQMNAQVSELAAQCGVLTNYTKQVVCRGGSSTAGVDTTMLQSYPFQLWQRYPEILWHNQGIGGARISTNGDTAGSSMYYVDGHFVDPLYNPSLEKNWLFFWGGINDIDSENLSGFGTYGRLTNYVAARKAAHPWTVVVTTLQHTLIAPASNAEYNVCLRTNKGYWDGMVDPGLNSPIETRLNDAHDTNYYFPDGLHLNNAGQHIMADHFGQKVNASRRSTGFFGP